MTKALYLFKYYMCNLFSNRPLFFILYIIYISVQCYPTENLKNFEIVDKDIQIYEEIYIANW